MSGMSGWNFGKEFCDAIGLDTKGIADIALHIPVDGAVVLMIKRYVQEEESQAMKQYMEKYELNLVDIDLMED